MAKHQTFFALAVLALAPVFAPLASANEADHKSVHTENPSQTEAFRQKILSRGISNKDKPRIQISDGRVLGMGMGRKKNKKLLSAMQCTPLAPGTSPTPAGLPAEVATDKKKRESLNPEGMRRRRKKSGKARELELFDAENENGFVMLRQDLVAETEQKVSEQVEMESIMKRILKRRAKSKKKKSKSGKVSVTRAPVSHLVQCAIFLFDPPPF